MVQDEVEKEGVEWVEADGKMDVDKPPKEKKVEWIEMDGEKLNVDKPKAEVRAEIAQQPAQPSLLQKLLTKKEQSQKPATIIRKPVAKSAPTTQTREERIQGRINWVKQMAGKMEGQKPKGKATAQPASQFGEISMGGGMMIQGLSSGGTGLGSMLMGGTAPERKGKARVQKSGGIDYAKLITGGTPSRQVRAKKVRQARAPKQQMNPMVKAMMGGKISNKKRWF